MKTILTILGVYEIIAVLLLASEDACESMFGYDFCGFDGFQYVVMCLLVPAAIGLLVWWWPEIKKNLDEGKKKSSARAVTRAKEEQKYKSEMIELDFERELNVVMAEYDEKYPKASKAARGLSKLHAITASYMDREIDREYVFKAVVTALDSIIKKSKDTEIVSEAKKLIKEIRQDEKSAIEDTNKVSLYDDDDDD